MIRAASGAATRLLGDPRSGLYVDYPPMAIPRYGFEQPPLQRIETLFAEGDERYRELLQSFRQWAEALRAIPSSQPDDDVTPCWNNAWLGAMNAVTLYALLARGESATFLEIGSGNSTKFARRVVTDQALATRIISVDPQPRAEIDRLCDDCFRTGLESLDLSVFLTLQAGDIVFFDGSHRVLQNSDVTVFMLEVLPELPAGTIVYVDDIYLPYDYPAAWSDRHYSEAYMLAAILMADGGRRYRPLMPHTYVARHETLGPFQQELIADLGIQVGEGNGIWLEIAEG